MVAGVTTEVNFEFYLILISLNVHSYYISSGLDLCHMTIHLQERLGNVGFGLSTFHLPQNYAFLSKEKQINKNDYRLGK